jgi:hypothetical protein
VGERGRKNKKEKQKQTKTVTKTGREIFGCMLSQIAPPFIHGYASLAPVNNTGRSYEQQHRN